MRLAAKARSRQAMFALTRGPRSLLRARAPGVLNGSAATKISVLSDVQQSAARRLIDLLWPVWSSMRLKLARLAIHRERLDQASWRP